MTKLRTEPYVAQTERWPKSGRHILAQFDDASVVVYQAYRPSIGRHAAEHGYFGGDFSLSRMSWIKPNFLWMMYRSGWGTKEGQEVRNSDIPRIGRLGYRRERRRKHGIERVRAAQVKAQLAQRRGVGRKARQPVAIGVQRSQEWRCGRYETDLRGELN